LVPVEARDPDLRVRPNDGPPGTSVLVRGRDFPAGATGTIAWGDLSISFGEFSASEEGDFEVTITVPDLSPGDYEVAAISHVAATVPTDTFTIEPPEGEDAPSVPPSGTPESIATGQSAPVVPDFVPNACDEPGAREVAVATSAELTAAIAGARPGDRITLADGAYPGNFETVVNGAADAPIALCGSRTATIAGEGWQESGYALHLTGDYWTVSGITVINAQKGVMADGVTGVVLDGIEVHTIGHEAVHFRNHSTDNVVQRSDIHDTGLDNEKFGEGVYLGTAVSNWERITGGGPDQSHRNRVLGNRIWNTTSESVDIKEGTEGGEVVGNVFDGSMLSGADSWVDVKGNDYLISGNLGVNTTQDGFQTHVIDDMEWGRNNTFTGNIARMDAPGFAFYIHQPEETNNIVSCDNEVEGSAGSGLTNIPGGCT
jgi:hypothetical protein